jgi:hypothetical protein
MPFSSVLGASSVIKPGVCTSSTRPTVPYEGQLIYETDTDLVLAYNGSSWATVGPASAGAMTLISATTIGSAVSTVTVTSAFSSTYDNYYITIAGGVSSALCVLSLKLGAVVTGYYGGLIQVNYASSAVTGIGDNNAAQFSYVGWASANSMCAQIFVNSPNLAKQTNVWAGPYIAGSTTGTYQGLTNLTTQHTDFTITPSTGTLTGGTIRVYGFANS